MDNIEQSKTSFSNDKQDKPRSISLQSIGVMLLQSRKFSRTIFLGEKFIKEIDSI